MTVVALALVAVLALVVAVFGAIVARMQRAHARREDLLVNQLLHAAGNAWQPPPAAVKPVREEPAEPAQVRFTASPEQLPVT